VAAATIIVPLVGTTSLVAAATPFSNVWKSEIGSCAHSCCPEAHSRGGSFEFLLIFVS